MHLENRLDQSYTSIHWHGLFIPCGMDGVTGLTQPGIQPGETWVYEFTIPAGHMFAANVSTTATDFEPVIATLNADGVWQGWQTQPRTQMNVRMDIADVGKTLTRWTYPAGIRRGTAKIEGRLSWAGGPHDFVQVIVACTVDVARRRDRRAGRRLQGCPA